MAVLSQFQFTEIVHGVQNIVADVLSRYADPQGPSYALGGGMGGWVCKS